MIEIKKRSGIIQNWVSVGELPWRSFSDLGLQPCLPLLLMPPCSCLPCGISVVNIYIYLDVTMVFLVYMYKLVYINSDSNQEEIRDNQKVGINGGATMEST